MAKLIVGYCDPLSAAPGDTVRFMISSLAAESFDAQLVRIVCGDISPEGAGYQEIEVSHPINGHYQGEAQPIVSGSYAVVEPHPFLRSLDSVAVGVWAWPTRPSTGRRQTLLSTWEQGSGFAIALDGDGHAVAEFGGSDGQRPSVLRTERPLAARRWTHLEVTYDAASRRGVLVATPHPLSPAERLTMSPSEAAGVFDASVSSGGPLLFAAEDIGSARPGEPLQRPPRRLPTGLRGGPSARGAVGLRVRHRDGQDLRRRWARAARLHPTTPDSSGARRELERSGARLASGSLPLRSDPLPRGRSCRRRVDAVLRTRRDRSSGERRVRPAGAHRFERGLHAVLRPAGGGRHPGSGGVPGSDGHLSRLRQHSAHRHDRPHLRQRQPGRDAQRALLARASRVRTWNLRPSPRRQRRGLQLAPAARPQPQTEVWSLGVHGRHQCDGVAGEDRGHLRRADR